MSYEDPRIFVGPDDNIYAQFVTSTYASKWDTTKHAMLNQPKICVGLVDEFGEAKDCIYPPIGNNLTEGKPEKNWCFFTKDKELKLLYSTMPIVIKTPGQPDKTIDSSSLKVVGDSPTFNSTAPIKIETNGLCSSIGSTWLLT